jgi:formylmethanofuran dehydrogenase subunit E
MLKLWEKFSYREQPDPEPPEHRCQDCGEYFYDWQITGVEDENGNDIRVCQECLKFYKQ